MPHSSSSSSTQRLQQHSGPARWRRRGHLQYRTRQLPHGASTRIWPSSSVPPLANQQWLPRSRRHQLVSCDPLCGQLVQPGAAAA